MPARSPQTYTAPSSLPAISGAITLKAVTDLPARLYGGNAQEVEVTGLDYTLHLDIEKLPVADGATAADKWTVVWDSAADTYARVEFINLPTPPTAWAAITGKPATFPPETHTHVIADTTGLQTALDGKVAKAGDTMAGVLAVTNTTASISKTTGAVTVAGGLGVAGKCHFGADLHVTQAFTDVTNGLGLQYGANAWNIFMGGDFFLYFAVNGNIRGAINSMTGAYTAYSSLGERMEMPSVEVLSARIAELEARIETLEGKAA